MGSGVWPGSPVRMGRFTVVAVGLVAFVAVTFGGYPNYNLRKPIAPSNFYETPYYGLAGHAPYYQKMRFYDPNWNMRYTSWLAGQAAFGYPFGVKDARINNWNKNSGDMQNLLKKGRYHAYNALRMKGNSLWKQYGYGLYGNAGFGKYKAKKHHLHKRSYGNSWIHGYGGFYGLGLNAISRLASGGPFGFYPYGGGYGGYGGYGGKYGGYGGYGFGGYGNFPWTGGMFYNKKFDYTAYNMANLMKKMSVPAYYGK